MGSSIAGERGEAVAAPPQQLDLLDLGFGVGWHSSWLKDNADDPPDWPVPRLCPNRVPNQSHGRDGGKSSSAPLQMVRSLQLLGSIPGIGAARSIAWSPET